MGTVQQAIRSTETIMKVIFECETEIGKCDDDLVNDPTFSGGTACEPWTVYAHTEASLAGSKRMLKIEQRCYLRRGDEIPDQNWVKPELIIEPVLGSEDETMALVQQTHECFIAKARRQLPEGSLVGTSC
jgi:hypothetical protein